MRSSSLLKILLSICLIALACFRLEPRSMVEQFIHQSLFWVSAAALVILGQIGIAAARWRIILIALGFDIPLKTVFFLTYIGSFFNSWLLGTMSGDVARALLAPSQERRRAAIIHSVLLDRVMTLCGLGLGVVPAILLDRGSFASHRWLPAPLPAVLLPLGILLFMTPIANFVGSFRLPFSNRIMEVADSWRRLYHAWPLFAAALALSVLAGVAISATAWCLGRAQHLNVSFVDFSLLMPAVVLLTALPISIGGWGVRENALVFALGSLGIGANAAMVLSVQMGVLVALLSVPGGGLWLWWASPIAADPSAAETAVVAEP